MIFCAIFLSLEKLNENRTKKHGIKGLYRLALQYVCNSSIVNETAEFIGKFLSAGSSITAFDMGGNNFDCKFFFEPYQITETKTKTVESSSLFSHGNRSPSKYYSFRMYICFHRWYTTVILSERGYCWGWGSKKISLKKVGVMNKFVYRSREARREKY